MNHEMMPEFGDSSSALRNLPDNQHEFEPNPEREITNEEAEQLAVRIKDHIIDPYVGTIGDDVISRDSLVAQSVYVIDGVEYSCEMARQTDEEESSIYTSYTLEALTSSKLANGNRLNVYDVYEISIEGKDEDYYTSFEREVVEIDPVTGDHIKNQHHQEKRQAYIEGDIDTTQERLAQRVAIGETGEITYGKYKELTEILEKLTPDKLVG